MHQWKEKRGCSSSRGRIRLGGALLLPGAAGGRRARLPRRRGPGRRRPAPAHRADARDRAALQRALRRGEILVVPEHRIPEVGARIMDLQDAGLEDGDDRRQPSRARSTCSTSPTSLRKKVRSAVTDSGTEVRRGDGQGGDLEPDRDPRRGPRRRPGRRRARVRGLRLRRLQGARSPRRSPRSWRRCASATPSCAPTRPSSSACSPPAPSGRARSPRRRSPTSARRWASAGRS